ncbi:MAG: radical SAM protein [Spirochaetes bacterium]|nr:radical SAM protein [Spirochaetota bacterium]
MAGVNYRSIDIKTLIRKQELADFFTISKYGFSPYRACEHGCSYCDGRAEKYYVEGEFDKDIVIRKNVPELLEREITRIRERGFLCIGSGVSDVYQPVEQREMIMRRCAEILAQFEIPVVILTKSSLIMRDLDLWAQINNKSRFLLMMSLTTTDESVRRQFEPNASPVEERLETLRRFKDAGCSTGVLAMPLLPYITETEKNIDALTDAVIQAGVDFFMPGGLTLRPGIQKDTFMKTVQRCYPGFTAEYERIYANSLSSGAPDRQWMKRNQPLYQRAIMRSGVSPVVPHTVFRGLVQIYEEVFLVLSLMKTAYEYRGVDTRRLSRAIGLYRNRVSEVRKPIPRSRSLSFDTVDRELAAICKSGEIRGVVQNEKTAAFITSIVLDRKIFDFRDMKFIGGS